MTKINTTPTITPHTLTAPDYAITVVQTLQEAGFEAYLVGGCIRDQLRGLHPKDFDVVTNAHPEQVKPLFKRCLLIGRRFRLAHVYEGRNMIEVATFRGKQDEAKASPHHARHEKSSIILRDNVYGTIEEDAARRDFTINALYYDPVKKVILDFCNGLEDIQSHTLRVIGEPKTRFREDPMRMLRALRFATKLDFELEPSIKEGIQELKDLLSHIAPARRFDEYTKLFLHGRSQGNYKTLKAYHVLSYLFPSLLKHEQDEAFQSMLWESLKNSDSRIEIGKGLNPAFLYAVFLWPEYKANLQAHLDHGLPWQDAQHAAARSVCQQQSQFTDLPRRLTASTHQIWHLQPLLEARQSRKIMSVLHHPRFRAAYDFLLLRAIKGEVDEQLSEWWTLIQTVPDDDKKQMIKALPKGKHPHRKRPRKRKGNTHGRSNG